MKLFILFFLPIIALAASERKKINLKPQTEKKMDDTASAEHLLYENPQMVEKNSTSNNPKLVAKSTCTDSLGMVHKQGDSSYDSCLRNLDKTTNASSQKRPSVGITIGK